MRVARFGNPNVEGDDHAARRQIELYRQTKTSGRTRRGRIRASRRRQEGSRTARVGDGQQGNRRRQQERLGTRRPGYQRVLETRRQDWRTARRQGFRKPSGRDAIALRKKGGRNPQAKRNGEVGSAQSRAERIALRRPARPCRQNPRARQNPRRTALSKVRRSRRWAALG